MAIICVLTETHRGGVAHDTETIFIEIFLLKPLACDSWYSLLTSQTSFLEKMNEHFYKFDTNKEIWYVFFLA